MVESKATISTLSDFSSQVYILESTPQLKALMTILRNKNTSRGDFIFYADRIIRLVIEEGKLMTVHFLETKYFYLIVGLNHLPFVEKVVTTPTGALYTGLGFSGKICGVSIMGTGEVMETALRDCCHSIRIGKIMIQFDKHAMIHKVRRKIS
jgi:uracil phosphoribosyltransferase